MGCVSAGGGRGRPRAGALRRARAHLREVHVLDVIGAVVILDLAACGEGWGRARAEGGDVGRARTGRSGGRAGRGAPVQSIVSTRNFCPGSTVATAGISGCQRLCIGVSCSHGSFLMSTEMSVGGMVERPAAARHGSRGTVVGAVPRHARARAPGAAPAASARAMLRRGGRPGTTAGDSTGGDASHPRARRPRRARRQPAPYENSRGASDVRRRVGTTLGIVESALYPV